MILSLSRYSIPSLPTERSALSCCVVDDLHFSQWLWGIGVRDQAARHRVPDRKRPQYHPSEWWMYEMQSSSENNRQSDSNIPAITNSSDIKSFADCNQLATLNLL